MKTIIFFLFVFLGMMSGASVVHAQSATLYFSPANVTVNPGQVFTVSVMVDTKGAEINAAGVYFTYPENLLEGVLVDTTGSLFDTFTPERTVAAGKVEFAAAKQPPPFSGIGKLFSVTFRAKSQLSSGILTFTADSAVLTHGDSQNILSLPASGNAQIQIVAPAPVPPPTPTPTPPPTPVPGPSPTPTAPEELTIFDIKAEKVSEETAVVSWKTNEQTRGQLNYGPSNQVSGTDYPFSILDATFRTEHSFSLSNVRNVEDYVLTIIATDNQGNQVKAEGLRMGDLFTEEAPPLPTPPSEVTPPQDDEGRRRVIFIAVPLVVLLLLGSFIFWRMKAQD